MSSVYYTNSFLLDQMQAVHNLGADTLKIALFDGTAAPSQSITAYSVTDEAVSGDGYTAGGETLSVVATYPKIENGQAATRIDDVSWTFTAQKFVRYGLIYNASQSDKSVAIFDFGGRRAYLGAFSLSFPMTQPALFLASTPSA